jgi:hypothetical protein
MIVSSKDDRKRKMALTNSGKNAENQETNLGLAMDCFGEGIRLTTYARCKLH